MVYSSLDVTKGKPHVRALGRAVGVLEHEGAVRGRSGRAATSFRGVVAGSRVGQVEAGASAMTASCRVTFAW
jgi:hypothetical protein